MRQTVRPVFICLLIILKLRSQSAGDNGGAKDKAENITFDVTICVPGQTNFTGYSHHFRMPSSESQGVENFWYSFDHGMVHYIQFDTETDLGHGLTGPDQPGGSDGEDSGPFGLMNQQVDWLRKDLAGVDRQKTPWVVAGGSIFLSLAVFSDEVIALSFLAGHRPWYVSSTACTECQEAFEGILNQYSVDLVLSGHVHVMERSAPMFNNTVDPNGLHNPKFPWYITNGAGGHYDGLDVLNPVLNSFSRFANDTKYGWSRLTFHNCTHLTHEFISSATGEPLDTATLFKNRKCNF